jgi:hypothetical protein
MRSLRIARQRGRRDRAHSCAAAMVGAFLSQPGHGQERVAINVCANHKPRSVKCAERSFRFVVSISIPSRQRSATVLPAIGAASGSPYQRPFPFRSPLALKHSTNAVRLLGDNIRTGAGFSRFALVLFAMRTASFTRQVCCCAVRWDRALELQSHFLPDILVSFTPMKRGGLSTPWNFASA